MSTYKKTAQEKLKTIINRLLQGEIKLVASKYLTVKDKKIVNVSGTIIKYSRTRYYPSKVDNLVDDDYTVSIPINHENLKILSANPINPPYGARTIMDLLRSATNTFFKSITLGADSNKIAGKNIFITKDLYDTILKIDKEEGKDKKIRFSNRANPFLRSDFGIKVDEKEATRNYSVLLKEVIASGEVTQKDILTLSEKLQTGESSNIVIEKQVVKQVKWLIESFEKIIDEKELTTSKAKVFGKEFFGFSKSEISGPEHLMEKILSKYGQYTLFGVPALINTKKYIIHKGGLSRSQFDIILITHLGDIEVVELKRPDETILEYDSGRGKFYASKTLSIAISQAERYISSVSKDNDDEYKIDGMKVRDFINGQVGATIFVESVRPSAVIIIGTYRTICKDYNDLDLSTKSKVTKNHYDNNSLRTYKELRNALKNVKIITYSELLENARTRLEYNK